jgi:hypothetical protein
MKILASLLATAPALVGGVMVANAQQSGSPATPSGTMAGAAVRPAPPRAWEHTCAAAGNAGDRVSQQVFLLSLVVPREIGYARSIACSRI